MRIKKFGTEGTGRTAVGLTVSIMTRLHTRSEECLQGEAVTAVVVTVHPVIGRSKVVTAPPGLLHKDRRLQTGRSLGARLSIDA